MQQTVWQNVFIQTLQLKFITKAFLYLPGVDYNPTTLSRGWSQPLHACTTSGSYVNKRCSAFNASVAAGICQTGGLVQSSLYSYAVLSLFGIVGDFGLIPPHVSVDIWHVPGDMQGSHTPEKHDIGPSVWCLECWMQQALIPSSSAVKIGPGDAWLPSTDDVSHWSWGRHP